MSPDDLGRIEAEQVTIGYAKEKRDVFSYICRGCVEAEEREIQERLRTPEAELEMHMDAVMRREAGL